MNTYGIGSDRTGTGDTYRQVFYIVEQGVRLPMEFPTSDEAWRHVQLLKAGPQLTRDEILDVVAEHIVNTRSEQIRRNKAIVSGFTRSKVERRPVGDLEYPRQQRDIVNPITAPLRPH